MTDLENRICEIELEIISLEYYLQYQAGSNQHKYDQKKRRLKNAKNMLKHLNQKLNQQPK